MDDTLCDFRGAYEDGLKYNPDIKYPQSQVDFFRQLKPLEGALESFSFLFYSEKFEVYILTAPSVKNPSSYTEKRLWVSDHLGEIVAERLIICPDKSLLKGDYLIDDLIQGKGQEGFEGTVIQYGSEAYPSWKEVCDFFL